MFTEGVSKLLTKELLFKERVNNGLALVGGLYRGKVADVDSIFAKANVEAITGKNKHLYEFIVTAKDEKRWKNSKAYFELWNRIESKLKKYQNQRLNIAQFPDDYYDLIEMISIDLTRRRIEEVDFTDRISMETVRADFSQSINIKEFLPYTGAFLPRTGAGESAPLIQHKTGEKGSVDLTLYDIGDERSIEDELYNTDIHSLQKVNNAVTRAYTALRNQLCLGPMIAYSTNNSWVLAQRVAADTNPSYELALYRTLRVAVRKLMALLDPQTLQEISYSRIALIVRNNVITFDLNRILRGQLALSRNSSGVGNEVLNVEPLPIDEIWKYRGDTLYIGPKKVEYPGVPEGKAYLVVTAASDNGNHTLTKRGLTMEMGTGDVMTLAREKRVWYAVHGAYNKEFYGETGGCASGTGYCVEIELPTFEEET